MSSGGAIAGDSAVLITGVGLVSAYGMREEHADAVVQGKSGLIWNPIAEGEPTAAWTSRVGDGFSVEAVLGKGNFRPLDRLGRFTACAVREAMKQAGLSVESDHDAAEGTDESELSLTVGTMFSGVSTIAAFDRNAISSGPKYAKPLDFANTVINAAAGQSAIWNRLRGPNTTLSGDTGAGLQAIEYEWYRIRNDARRVSLCGGMEEVSEESLRSFKQANLLGSESAYAPRPFGGGDSVGIALGEGAGMFVLERSESAAKRKATVLAKLEWVATEYISDGLADRQAATDRLAALVRRGLETLRLAPDAVNFWSASANGGALDPIESDAMQLLYPQSSARPRTLAVKGLLGECLGASVSFQLAAAVDWLSGRRMPAEARSRDGVLPRRALLTVVSPDGVIGAVILSSCSD